MGEFDDALDAARRRRQADVENAAPLGQWQEERTEALRARALKFIDSERKAGYPTVVIMQRRVGERVIEHRGGFLNRVQRTEAIPTYREEPGWVIYERTDHDTYDSTYSITRRYLCLDGSVEPSYAETDLDRFLQPKGY